MADSKELKDPINVGKLKSLYSSHEHSGLNTALRNGLEAFAASTRSGFTQDDVGNVYITRPGTDPSVCAIALTFPLDSSSSSPHDTFSGALHTFLELLHTTTGCDVSLLGWSSLGNSTVGRDVWEEGLSVHEAYEEFPELKAFDGRGDVSAFGCSALLELIEVDGAALVVRGDALLAEKARGYLPAHGSVAVAGEGPNSSRCPVVSICGDGAIGVGKKVVIDYSEYVAKLFENFD
ncbi:hypothetical protein HO133_005610 [Letharia lupina]|uniref:Uncharacterized protein n=1 Tax=Letharia lupina TaxID=560253 RepID=A0A8H6F8N3_9LECA|nr:uncharacterized protein HO133_005610 [Letharia lupina]KAF6219066.1 hypothetical protein HO133_005610 [Letharia lupina]